MLYSLEKMWLLLMLFYFCSSETIWNIKSKRSLNMDQNNMGGVVEKGYYVEVLLGTPPQALNILIDTGSSNFAVASKKNALITKYFDATNSTSLQPTNLNDVDIRYTEGFWRGHLVSDIVSIPSANFSDGLQVDFAEIEDSSNFFIKNSGWQGILGMAYNSIIRPQNSNLKSFASVVLGNSDMDNIFSLQLCMANVRYFSNKVSGKFILGGYDRSLEDIYWSPIVKEWYYEVRVLGLQVGNSSVSVACSEFNNDKSIVDSGTTNLRLPTVIFDQVVLKIKNHLLSKDPSLKRISGKFWNGTDDLCWDLFESPYFVFPTITVYLPSTEFNHTISLHVHSEHYILYRGNMTKASEVMACYKFGISPSDTGTVLGAVLMEQYNVIFDRNNKRIGFATSDCSPTSVIHYIPGYINATDCIYVASNELSTLQIASYILLGLVALCMLPVCILVCSWFLKQRTRNSSDADNLLHTSSLND